MTKLHVLEALAEKCRVGLATLADQRDSMFAGFPTATCGNAAEIVGRILKEQAGYDGQYVEGNGHPNLKPGQSHAWYEVGDYIIDITYDQFEGTGLTGWVFHRGHDWHAEFADISYTPGFNTPRTWKSYPYDGYEAVMLELQTRPAT